jgi:hypothetical protein
LWLFLIEQMSAIANSEDALVTAQAIKLKVVVESALNFNESQLESFRHMLGEATIQQIFDILKLSDRDSYGPKHKKQKAIKVRKLENAAIEYWESLTDDKLKEIKNAADPRFSPDLNPIVAWERINNSSISSLYQSALCFIAIHRGFEKVIDYAAIVTIGHFFKMFLTATTPTTNYKTFQ